MQMFCGSLHKPALAYCIYKLLNHKKKTVQHQLIYNSWGSIHNTCLGVYCFKCIKQYTTHCVIIKAYITFVAA